MKSIHMLLALLLTLGCLISTALAADTTLMMYMCGTDLQSDCLADLKEMCSVNADRHVRIVVLAGGASKWDDKKLKANRLNLFTIEKGAFSAVTDWGKSSMGSADTLSRFVSYAWQNYRSDRNILVLWDHGGGTSQGVCFDEVYDDDGLTLTELNAALASVQKQNQDFHLDILGCDACLMAGYELAVLASDYADYFVASEELEPSLGWYYTDWLNALDKDPNRTTADVCRDIVEAYSAACKRKRAAEYTTLSAIDLHKLGALQADMEQLSVYLQDALAHGQLAAISRAVSRMYAMGSFESSDGDNDMYDLGQLLDLGEQFAPDTVAAARQHLQEAVICNYTSGDVPSASGLAVYIPQNSKKWYIRDTKAGYELTQKIPAYAGFVSALVNQTNGSSYTFTASAPASQNAGQISASASQFAGYIPVGTYNAETGTAPSFVAGTAGQQGGVVTGYVVGNVPAFVAGSAGGANNTGASAGSAPAQNVPSFIAGTVQTGGPSTPGSTVAPPSAGQQISASAMPAVSINGVPSFIAGNAGAVAQQPAPASDDPAFSIRLSREDLEYLSYVEGALYMDLSNEDELRLLDLGYMRNSWVDWAEGVAYSTFDRTWPSLDGQLIVLYERSATEVSRRSLIPVKVNGKETYLVVSFDAGSSTGRILGHNAGVDDNGLLIRHVEPLKDGDIIIPLYTLYYCGWDEEDNDDDMDERVYEGKPIRWRDGLAVTNRPLKEVDVTNEYQFAFYLNDIFGEYDMTDFIPLTL